MNEFPISAPKADAIRDRFTANADAMQAKIDSGEYPESFQRQVDSWRHMAQKRYEAMRIVGDI